MSAAPLVLVHGFLGSAHDWDALLPLLPVDREVLCPELRGHGSARRGPYTFDLLVQDLIPVITPLGPVHLVGHSLGGILALRVALEHPGLLASLVVMDCAPEPAGRLPITALGAVSALGRLIGMPLAARLLRRASFGHLDPQAVWAIGRELNSYPSTVAQLSAIGVPTTVVVGSEDKGLCPAAVQMAALIPDAQLAVIEGAGHNPQRDRPEELVAVLQRHLVRG